MHPLTDTERKYLDDEAKLQTDIDKAQVALRELQAKQRTTGKERLRLHQETLGSWVMQAGLDTLDPSVLQPGLLALGALAKNPGALAAFCAEWLTAEEAASTKTSRPLKAAQDAA